MKADEKPWVNYFTQSLSEDKAAVLVEIFDSEGNLLDVETMSVYRSNLSECNQQAIAENKAAVERGDHISQHRASQSAAA